MFWILDVSVLKSINMWLFHQILNLILLVGLIFVVFLIVGFISLIIDEYKKDKKKAENKNKKDKNYKYDENGVHIEINMDDNY